MENEEIVNKHIGRNIASYRRAANFTQAELAQKINYSTTIHSYYYCKD